MRTHITVVYGWWAIAALAMVVGLPSTGAAQQATPSPTFTRDVAPIFQEKCEACHRPESIAPMSLVTYQETRPWIRSIRQRVSTRQMPPWHLDKTVGIQQYKNDRSLTDAQIATIVKWIDSGAPMGAPADMPAARQWPNESIWNYAERFGPPDLVLKSPPFTMKAQTQDVWFRTLVPTGLTQPRWVRAIEMRPSTVKGRRVTHHATAQLEQGQPDAAVGRELQAAKNDAKDVVPEPEGPAFFMEWAVGKPGELMRPDSGKLMLPGAQIHWDVHYSAAGEEITDSVELGIYFYPVGHTPKYRQHLIALYASELPPDDVRRGPFSRLPQPIDIPPNTVTMTQGHHVLRQNARIESFQPHMHLRGKAMSLEAILPDGSVRVLSHVGNFNFNWHNNYVYADDAAPLLPKGAVVRVTAWHDNTAANRANPDPNQWVGYGDRTVDEMAHSWTGITYLSDEEFAAELKKRRDNTSTQQQ